MLKRFSERRILQLKKLFEDVVDDDYNEMMISI